MMHFSDSGAAELAMLCFTAELRRATPMQLRNVIQGHRLQVLRVENTGTKFGGAMHSQTAEEGAPCTVADYP